VPKNEGRIIKMDVRLFLPSKREFVLCRPNENNILPFDK